MNNTAHIMPAKTPAEIGGCFAVIQELRPRLKDKEAFIAQIKRQIQEGYMFVFMQEGSETVACMGFRMFETLPWGKILYIDDLVTREKSRKKGYAETLIAYAVDQGRIHHCQEIHLDSGHHRHDAHRFYLNQGFTLYCHHFARHLGTT
jgi:GNAT superfamily N-acetyltransferase